MTDQENPPKGVILPRKHVLSDLPDRVKIISPFL